jgi:hypothetical protein
LKLDANLKHWYNHYAVHALEEACIRSYAVHALEEACIRSYAVHALEEACIRSYAVHALEDHTMSIIMQCNCIPAA